MSSVELLLDDDDDFCESDYSERNESGSRSLKSIIPVLPASPRKHQRQQARQQSIFSDHGRSSSSHYYTSGSSGELTSMTTSDSSRRHARHYYSYGPGPHHERSQLELMADENRKLRRENLILQTEVSTIRDLYHTLAQSLPRVLATSPSLRAQSPSLLSTPSCSTALNFIPTSNIASDQPLNRSDYPKVRYWFRKDWIDRKKEKMGTTKLDTSSTTENSKGRAPLGLNVTLRYVEDEHGMVIDGFRASDMRKFARSIWNQLMGAGKAPRSWGKADLDVAAHYRREMRNRFPELALCEFDWKAEQLATDNYPNWASNSLQVIKEESDNNVSAGKRRRESVTHVSKRAKIGSNSPINAEPFQSALSPVGPTASFPPTGTDFHGITSSTIRPSSAAAVAAPVATTITTTTIPIITVSAPAAGPLNADEPTPATNNTDPALTAVLTISPVHGDHPVIEGPTTNITSDEGHATNITYDEVAISTNNAIASVAQGLVEGNVVLNPATSSNITRTTTTPNLVASGERPDLRQRQNRKHHTRNEILSRSSDAPPLEI